MDKCKDHNSFIEIIKITEKRVDKIDNDIYGETGDDKSIFERFRGIDLRFDTLEIMIKNVNDKPKFIIIWAERLFKLFITGSIVTGIILKIAGKL